MGQVFRALDTKLDREVAIKMLPPAFAADSQRLARFRREAQVLASLNHPKSRFQSGERAVADPAGRYRKAADLHDSGRNRLG